MNIEKDLQKLKKNLNERKKSLTLDEIYSLLGWSPKFKKENREIVKQADKKIELVAEKIKQGQYTKDGISFFLIY